MTPVAIAHYHVTAKIGEGGMDAVYRALDTKLNREVAVKVLPTPFAGSVDRITRFAGEAEVLASLDHASIAVARQIVDALDHAHGKGVIHRDLKPANVKFTAAGRAKLLDFGLAKALAPLDTVDGATMTMHATLAGVVMGTLGYMSPEQATGGPVDKRADILGLRRRVVRNAGRAPPGSSRPGLEGASRCAARRRGPSPPSPSAAGFSRAPSGYRRRKALPGRARPCRCPGFWPPRRMGSVGR